MENNTKKTDLSELLGRPVENKIQQLLNEGAITVNDLVIYYLDGKLRTGLGLDESDLNLLKSLTRDDYEEISNA